MGTKNNPGNINCYARALPDEHVFVLLGRDPATPSTIRFWMGERARLGKNKDPDDLHKLGEAGMVADAAEKWRAALIELAGTDGILPWHINPRDDTWGNDERPVRALPGEDRPWSGESGGPVKFPDPALFYSEWEVSGHLAVGTFYANEAKPHDSESWVQTFAEADRQGYMFEGDISPFTGVVVHLYRKRERVDFIGGSSFAFHRDPGEREIGKRSELGAPYGVEPTEDRLTKALASGKVRRSLRKALARGYAGQRHPEDDEAAPEGVFYPIRLYDDEHLGAYAGVAGPDHSVMCEITPDSVVGGTQEACMVVAMQIAASMNLGRRFLDVTDGPQHGYRHDHVVEAVVPETALDFGDDEDALGDGSDYGLTGLAAEPFKGLVEGAFRPTEIIGGSVPCEQDTIERCRGRAILLHDSLTEPEQQALRGCMEEQFGPFVGDLRDNLSDTQEIEPICRFITLAEATIGARGPDLGNQQQP